MDFNFQQIQRRRRLQGEQMWFLFNGMSMSMCNSLYSSLNHTHYPSYFQIPCLFPHSLSLFLLQKSQLLTKKLPIPLKTNFIRNPFSFETRIPKNFESR
ncbi:hypothetical protein AQUCO_02600004v1 [Aquilegia coerulea]|uniref:Uncharacterized protein n=1 Tax=Aquilegia coerulea TaxID=218851 RepID=A0A2G5D6Y1_AQUCA|nr:hypothetical protein AQUCO_02600004v1 [Aquilegia coerulea]